MVTVRFASAASAPADPHRLHETRVRRDVPLSNSEARHVLVVYDGSSAARAALASAGALIDEHQSMVTVITLVVHDRRSVGCCVPAATWNRELDLLAEELKEARGLLFWGPTVGQGGSSPSREVHAR